jgi:peptide chain release factor subunit 1
VDSADEKVKCRECGATATVEVDNDLIDDFFEIADSYNTKVEIISEESEEGEMLMKAFGGIAAILRYRIQ